MPNIKSAKKRVKVSKVRTDRNKARNSALKTAIKKANVAIETNDANKEVLVKAAVKKIDQAAAKGLIHKNNAARKVSALSSKLNGWETVLEAPFFLLKILIDKLYSYIV